MLVCPLHDNVVTTVSGGRNLALVGGIVARAPRRRVSIPARMRAGGAPVSVCIRDISPRSMLLEVAVAPLPGTFVEIIGAEASIAGQVIWSKDDRFGVRTRERLNVKATTAELKSLRLTAGELADAPCATPKRTRFDLGERDLGFRAERSRMMGRRLEQVAIAASVAIAGVLAAAAAYHTLARPLAAVAASSSGNK
jgi:hypothetical protein